MPACVGPGGPPPAVGDGLDPEIVGGGVKLGEPLVTSGATPEISSCILVGRPTSVESSSGGHVPPCMYAR